ncbi:hypothetical protein [Sphingobacterium sp.]|uniref:hypothetical protein n=1 Tax=Sphingobacterium sp. TaxID=341027 RepID=UPI002591261E|nr:hypothetical protein [Sphingobacterium sp.]WET69064.1 MAG: hypothetical protein P0Y57_24790 [Sphingobacterium sp.]
MTKNQVEEYLTGLENKLLNSERIEIDFSRNWANTFPAEAAVYIFRRENELVYVGETGSLKERMLDILNTKNHSLRRNFGNHHFCGHPMYEKPSSKKSFCIEIELLLNQNMSKELTLSYLLADLGRKELEERLFGKHKPQYAIKGKRGSKKL